MNDAARRVRLPRGAKRAVLFAIGIGAATSGCDAFSDPVDTTTDTSPFPQSQPAYGAVVSGPFPTGTGTTMPTPTAFPTGAPSDTMAPTTTVPSTGPSTTTMPSPVNSEPVPAASTATSGTGFTPDAGPSASNVLPDAAAGGGGAAAATDAGMDAGAPDAAPADSSEGGAIEMPGPVPPYGAPPQPVYGAPPAAP